MAQLVGHSESYALLQVWGNPTNAPSSLELGTRLGTHAITFTGRASTGHKSTDPTVIDLLTDPLLQELQKKKDALPDPDNAFDWDLDITVGPEWRDVKQVAALVVVASASSSNTDSDDEFLFDVRPRTPPWSVRSTIGSGPLRIVLHVTVSQAGEYLNLEAFNYSVTATGALRDGEIERLSPSV